MVTRFNPPPGYAKPPAPPPPPLYGVPMWRCSCQGCGAPLQLADMQCSYCLRVTGVLMPVIPQPKPDVYR